MARHRLALTALAALAASACGGQRASCVDVATVVQPAFKGSVVNTHGDDRTGVLDINGQAISIDFVDMTPHEKGGVVARYTTQYIEDDAPTTFMGPSALVDELIDTQGMSREQGRDLELALDAYLDTINEGFQVDYRHGVQNVAFATEQLNADLAAIATDHPEETTTERVCERDDLPEVASTAGFDGDFVAADAPQEKQGQFPWLAAIATLGGVFLAMAYKKRQHFTHERTVTAKLKNVDHSIVILRNENIKDEGHKQAYWILAQADNADAAKAAKGKVRLFSTNAEGIETILAADKEYIMHPKLAKDTLGKTFGKKGDNIGDLGTVVREGPVRRALQAVDVAEDDGTTQRVLNAAIKQLHL